VVVRYFSRIMSTPTGSLQQSKLTFELRYFVVRPAYPSRTSLSGSFPRVSEFRSNGQRHELARYIQAKVCLDAMLKLPSGGVGFSVKHNLDDGLYSVYDFRASRRPFRYIDVLSTTAPTKAPA